MCWACKRDTVTLLYTTKLEKGLSVIISETYSERWERDIQLPIYSVAIWYGASPLTGWNYKNRKEAIDKHTQIVKTYKVTGSLLVD